MILFIYFTKLQFDRKIEENISAFDDVGMDSIYPLMTSDPDKGKEFTVKITNKKLDNVFDHKNNNDFNLQSIMIQNYIPAGNKATNNKDSWDGSCLLLYIYFGKQAMEIFMLI